MSDTSRRGFLAIAGAGAAGVAVAAVAGNASAGAATVAAAPRSTETELPADASGSLVAYISDVRDGRVSVMVGEREVVIRDREVVARLANAAKKATSETGA